MRFLRQFRTFVEAQVKRGVDDLVVGVRELLVPGGTFVESSSAGDRVVPAAAGESEENREREKDEWKGRRRVRG